MDNPNNLPCRDISDGNRLSIRYYELKRFHTRAYFNKFIWKPKVFSGYPKHLIENDLS